MRVPLAPHPMTRCNSSARVWLRPQAGQTPLTHRQAADQGQGQGRVEGGRMTFYRAMRPTPVLLLAVPFRREKRSSRRSLRAVGMIYWWPFITRVAFHPPSGLNIIPSRLRTKRWLIAQKPALP